MAFFCGPFNSVGSGAVGSKAVFLDPSLGGPQGGTAWNLQVRWVALIPILARFKK